MSELTQPASKGKGPDPKDMEQVPVEDERAPDADEGDEHDEHGDEIVHEVVVVEAETTTTELVFQWVVGPVVLVVVTTVMGVWAKRMMKKRKTQVIECSDGTDARASIKRQ